jgi:hypothetical protein
MYTETSNLKNSQDYAQKHQQNCTFMNSASDQNADFFKNLLGGGGGVNYTIILSVLLLLLLLLRQPPDVAEED